MPIGKGAHRDPTDTAMGDVPDASPEPHRVLRKVTNAAPRSPFGGDARMKSISAGQIETKMAQNGPRLVEIRRRNDDPGEA